MSFDNSKVIATKGYLIGSADAIRRKLGTSDTITLPNFESAIDSIHSGGGEPYIPREQIVCDFDFTSNTPYYDSVRQSSVQTPSGVIASSDGIELTTKNSYVPTYKGLSKGEFYKIELEFGNYNIDTSAVEDTSAILNFSTVNPQNEQGSICWRKNVSAWACYTTNGWNNFPSSYGIDAFKNKKIIVLFNCRYTDGEFVPIADADLHEYHNINIYDEDMNYIIGNIVPNSEYVQAIGIGGCNGYSCKGMVVKSLKVYNLNLYTDPSQDIIQPITITANGTYTANGNTVAGYSPITVNVPPTKVLISEFDFKSNSPWYDIVKKGNLGTLMHYGTATQGVGLEFMTTGQRVRTGTIFDYCGVYEMEVKFGTFNKENAPSTGNNFLLCFSRNNYSAMLCFKNYNSETGLGDWWIHDQSGNNIYLDDVHEPYFFENKTLKILFGAKLVDGELVRDFNRIYYYIDDVQLNANGAVVAGDVDNSIGVVHLGDRQSATFKGAVFEGFKIWQYFDKYETPASLMMAVPEEAEEVKTEIVKDEKSIEEVVEKTKEDEEITKKESEN